MTRSIIPSLLGVSLLFNAGFSAGYLKARFGEAEPAKPDAAEQFASELQLTSEQRDLFDRLREQAREEQTPLRDAMTLVQTDLLTTYREAPDHRERIEGLYEELSDLRLAYWESSTDPMLQFYARLDEDQRQRLNDRMAGNPRMEAFRRLMGEFDADGDGRLNDSERQKAYQSFRGRLQDRLPQRPQSGREIPEHRPEATPQNPATGAGFRLHRLRMLQRLQQERGGEHRPLFRERLNESRDAAPR